MITYLKAQPGLEGYAVYSIDEFVSLFSVNNVPGLKAFTAAVLGGIGSIPGAVLVGNVRIGGSR